MIDQKARRELLQRMTADGIQFVSLQFIDIPGAVKNVTIPVDRLDEALERGVWFDGSSIEGFARIYETDMMLKPDPTTYCLLPWEPASCPVARLICDIHTPQGDMFEGDPRYILKRALAEAEALGYQVNVGPEFEFFLFRMDGQPHIRPVPHDVGGYFDFSPRDTAARVRQDISVTLEAMGIMVEKVHHEVASGQHEIDIHYANALTSADNVITTKYAIRAVAQSHGLCATFMPKPVFGINGSGMHTHQSLFNAEGRNIFFDPDDPYRLSPVAYQFIAGQLTHAPGLAALVAPTVNSYKRLVPGYEAPAYICWGQVNRSALIRIPRYSPGWEQATRAELRCPDPSCNPYLAFAGMLMAGLDGIRREMTPPPSVEENVYDFDDSRLRELNIDTLPRTLGEALEALEADEVLRAALGSHACERYLDAKWTEWREYNIQVTDWERARYLETA